MDTLAAVLQESHRRGFLGPGPIEPHLDNARFFSDAVPLDRVGSFLDMGSGGGLPGLPLLVWNPHLRGVLVDSRARRTRFLDEAVQGLSLSERVQVVTGRIEDVLNSLGQHELVTARSFGPPSATVELGAQLLSQGGLIAISEPPGGRLWAADGLHSLGLVQTSAAGAPVAVFKRMGSTSPKRTWKQLVSRPVVDVRGVGT